MASSLVVAPAPGPGQVCCLLCQTVVEYDGRDTGGYSRHLQQHHSVSSNSEWLIHQTILNQILDTGPVKTRVSVCTENQTLVYIKDVDAPSGKRSDRKASGEGSNVSGNDEKENEWQSVHHLTLRNGTVKEVRLRRCQVRLKNISQKIVFPADYQMERNSGDSHAEVNSVIDSTVNGEETEQLESEPTGKASIEISSPIPEDNDSNPLGSNIEDNVERPPSSSEDDHCNGDYLTETGCDLATLEPLEHDLESVGEGAKLTSNTIDSALDDDSRQSSVDGGDSTPPKQELKPEYIEYRSAEDGIKCKTLIIKSDSPKKSSPHFQLIKRKRKSSDVEVKVKKLKIESKTVTATVRAWPNSGNCCQKNEEGEELSNNLKRGCTIVCKHCGKEMLADVHLFHLKTSHSEREKIHSDSLLDQSKLKKIVFHKCSVCDEKILLTLRSVTDHIKKHNIMPRDYITRNMKNDIKQTDEILAPKSEVTSIPNSSTTGKSLTRNPKSGSSADISSYSPRGTLEDSCNISNRLLANGTDNKCLSKCFICDTNVKNLASHLKKEHNNRQNLETFWKGKENERKRDVKDNHIENPVEIENSTSSSQSTNNFDGQNIDVKLSSRIYSDMSDETCMFKCSICQTKIKSIRSHLTSVHQMTVDAYVLQYGNPFVVKETYQKCKLCDGEALYTPENLRSHLLKRHKLKAKQYEEKYLGSDENAWWDGLEENPNEGKDRGNTDNSTDLDVELGKSSPRISSDKADGTDLFKCRICNDDFTSLENHVPNDHNLSLSEYISVYGEPYLERQTYKCKMYEKDILFTQEKLRPHIRKQSKQHTEGFHYGQDKKENIKAKKNVSKNYVKIDKNVIKKRNSGRISNFRTGKDEDISTKIYTDMTYDCCIFKCFICKKTIKCFRTHVLRVHNISLSSYISRYGNPEILKETYHKCKQCGEEIFFTRDNLHSHQKYKHNLSGKDYSEKFLQGGEKVIKSVRGGRKLRKPLAAQPETLVELRENTNSTSLIKLGIQRQNNKQRELYLRTTKTAGKTSEFCEKKDRTGMPNLQQGYTPLVHQNQAHNFEQDPSSVAQDLTSVEQDHTVVKKDHTIGKQDHTTSKQDYATGKQDPIPDNQDHTVNKKDDTAVKQDHIVVKLDHTNGQPDHVQRGGTIALKDGTPIQRDEHLFQRDEPPIKQDEPPIQQDEHPIKQDEPPIQQDEHLIQADEHLIQHDLARAANKENGGAGEWYDGNTFTCRKCSFTTNSLDSVKEHVTKAHRGSRGKLFTETEEMYECQFCLEEVYHEKSAITRHLETEHFLTVPKYAQLYVENVTKIRKRTDSNVSSFEAEEPMNISHDDLEKEGTIKCTTDNLNETLAKTTDLETETEIYCQELKAASTGDALDDDKDQFVTDITRHDRLTVRNNSNTVIVDDSLDGDGEEFTAGNEISRHVRSSAKINSNQTKTKNYKQGSRYHGYLRRQTQLNGTNSCVIDTSYGEKEPTSNDTDVSRNVLSTLKINSTVEDPCVDPCPTEKGPSATNKALPDSVEFVVQSTTDQAISPDSPKTGVKNYVEGPSSKQVQQDDHLYLCPFENCKFQTDIQGMSSGVASQHCYLSHHVLPVQLKKSGKRFKRITVEEKLRLLDC